MARGVSRLACRTVLHQLADFLEDKLDTGARRQVHNHLIRCKTCRMALDLAKETLATYFTPDADPARYSLN